MDSDDEIEVNFLEKLYYLAQREKLDIVKGNTLYIEPNGDTFSRTDLNDKVKHNHLSFHCHFWSALYRASFLKQNKIYFPQSRNLGEDDIFLTRVVLRINKIGVIDDTHYIYNRREESRFPNDLSNEQFAGLSASVLLICSEVNEFYPKYLSREDYSLMFRDRMYWGLYWLHLNPSESNIRIMSNTLIQVYDLCQVKDLLNDCIKIFGKCTTAAEIERLLAQFIENKTFSGFCCQINTMSTPTPPIQSLKRCTLTNFNDLHIDVGAAHMHDNLITKEEITFSLCSCQIVSQPRVKLNHSGHATMEQFIQLRQKCINEGSVECDTCEWYKEDSLSHASQPHLAYVSVNLYPAPCNGSCIYCNKKSLLNRPIDKIVYERVLDSLQYAIEKAWITKDTRWQISSGEITVHPYKKEILGLIKNSPCSIFTNAIIYDEDIAKILSQNNRASIFVSIDAGTRDTFQKVKRANNFEVVVNNLRRYKEQCLEAEQIMLKYIVLPGVNDATADHEGMIKIMKELEITDLTIAHEAMEKVYGVDTKTKTAAAHLLALLMKNNFTHNTYFPYFFPSVMKEVEELAKELIEKEKLYATSTPPNTLTCLT